jgi:hypothetical protein
MLKTRRCGTLDEPPQMPIAVRTNLPTDKLEFQA